MNTPALFDYSDKPTEWLRSIIAKAGMFNEELRERVVSSAKSELLKRGEVVE